MAIAIVTTAAPAHGRRRPGHPSPVAGNCRRGTIRDTARRSTRESRPPRTLARPGPAETHPTQTTQWTTCGSVAAIMPIGVEISTETGERRHRERNRHRQPMRDQLTPNGIRDTNDSLPPRQKTHAASSSTESTTADWCPAPCVAAPAGPVWRPRPGSHWSHLAAVATPEK